MSHTEFRSIHYQTENTVPNHNQKKNIQFEKNEKHITL